MVNGDVYEGCVHNGVRSGHGILKSANGDIYIGEWVNGYQHGQGTFCAADRTLIVGMWENGQYIGFYSLICLCGAMAENEWCCATPESRKKVE
jgi:hypothetical protein